MKSAIIVLEKTDSTMNYARELAKAGCPPFTVISAKKQTFGKGRMKRNWLSSFGGLYFTVVLRPSVSPDMAHIFNFKASFSMARVLQKKFGIETGLKWPNDILANGKKICGILSEMKADNGKISFVNIGIGVNINNDSFPDETNAISVKEILGKEIKEDFVNIIYDFIEEFQKERVGKKFSSTIEKWKKKSITIGKKVKIVTIKDRYEGIALDIDDTGALLLELSDGSLKKIIYGDCFHSV